jgi:hypothetical protein
MAWCAQAIGALHDATEAERVVHAAADDTEAGAVGCALDILLVVEEVSWVATAPKSALIAVTADACRRVHTAAVSPQSAVSLPVRAQVADPATSHTHYPVNALRNLARLQVRLPWGRCVWVAPA